MRHGQTHQETCPQIIPLGLLDLERLVKVISGLWDILMVLRRWFGLRRRLLIGRLLVAWLLVIRLLVIRLLVIRLRVVWLWVVWLWVWRRRSIWLLIVPIVGLRPALREALVIIAGSLSTHVCDAERREKGQKEKDKKGVFRLVTTSNKTAGNLRSATQMSSPTWDRSNLRIHPRH